MAQNATIHPYLPKAGSSTLNAFQSFLAALDGVNEAPGTDNDPTSHSAASQIWQGQPGAPAITDANWNTGSRRPSRPPRRTSRSTTRRSIIKDANAIEPFSYGRAQLANGASQTVRIEGGWSADRELYHVVRGQNIAGAATTPFVYGSDGGVLENLFSNTGYVCTNATAKADIAGAGFWPLQTGTATGQLRCEERQHRGHHQPVRLQRRGRGCRHHHECLLRRRARSTSPSPAARATPTGSVQLVVANPSTPAGSPAASFHKTVRSGRRRRGAVTLPATVSGTKTFDVAYLPTSFGANASAGGHTALGSSYTEFNARVPGGQGGDHGEGDAPSPPRWRTRRANTKVTVTVKAASGTVKPTGTIKIMRRHKKVGTGTLKKGKVTHHRQGHVVEEGQEQARRQVRPVGQLHRPEEVARASRSTARSDTGWWAGARPGPPPRPTPTHEPRDTP